MINRKTRLELTWIGKENRPRLEPRILVADSEKSYHAAHRITDNDLFDNRLIFGDNLLALKALEQEFTGQVKCIYIDPPYNTGSAFAHYDDGVEHSIWLSLMRNRLEILRRLLTEDGSIWISLDDNEAHYCRVLMDEIFGRPNFVATVVWQKKHTRSNDAKWFSDNHDFILVYANNKEIWRPCLLPREASHNAGYSNPDNDIRGPWASQPLQVKTPSDAYIYEIVTPAGRKFWPPKGRSWQFGLARYEELVKDNRIWFGKNGQNVPRIKKFLSEVKDGLVPITLWMREEVGDNQEAKKEAKNINEMDPFGTPKPERLLARIITLATNPGDLVLDSFAGSGTTGAVAHKMGRRWIMVELGEHCHSHIIPRLRKVIDGEDRGGISKAVNWRGGGGFRYFKLGPSLIVKDSWGNPVINPEFDAAMLAEAMCKLEGFTFAPNPDNYWQQGYSSETDFIYVTTQMLTAETLTMISDAVGPNRSLLICCGAFKGDTGRFENLTVKKIPKSVLHKCEWSHNDYSLEIENLPKAPVTTIADREVAEQPQSSARDFGKNKNLGPCMRIGSTA